MKPIAAAKWTIRWLSRFSLMAVSLLVLVCVTPFGKWLGANFRDGVPVDKLKYAEAIVILGGDRLRALDAVELLNKKLAPKIIISGGITPARTVLDLFRIPESQIIEDPLPTNTAAHPLTLLMIPTIKKNSPLILVTSQYHQLRARRVFVKAGYTDIQVHSNRPSTSSLEFRGSIGIKNGAQLIYELLAISKYYALGLV